MPRISVLFSVLLAMALGLGACSSASRKQDPQKVVTVVVAPDTVTANNTESKKEPVYRDKGPAHEAFILAQEMELRGERQLAEIYWRRAYEADPESRYLAFNVAERMFAHGDDSAALDLASKAVGFKGKCSVDQYELLAKLYVRAGVADSARKYFNFALDSSHYQNMSLLYDYSLFLEAVRDSKELVKVYDLLLPQVNYIQTLFQRQVNLLLELKKDSAVIELFGKAYEATGDRSLLSRMVRGLAAQRRYIEVRAIADTITSMTADDESIISTALLTYGEGNRNEVLKFLKKKVHVDGMRSSVMLYYLGNYEYSEGERDSAKVHLLAVYDKLENTAYAAQACRALAGLAFVEDKKMDGVKYAKMADSILAGGDKDFLASAYGYAGMYTKAYSLLDSLLNVWGHWTPMAGVADSATLKLLNQKAVRTYYQLQNTYARVLISEARGIEDDGKSDSSKLAYALEARAKAELFMERLLTEEPLNMFLRFSMAMNLERMKRYDESFEMFEFLLKQPMNGVLNWPEILNYYGYSLVDLNRSPEEVEKGFQLILRALEMEKNEPSESFLDSKAWGLYRKGNFAEALELMNSIKNPAFQKDYVYWEHMAAIQAALGQNSEAAKSYKNVLKLRPGHSAAKEFLNKKK